MKKFSLVIIILFVSLVIVNCGESKGDLNEKVKSAGDPDEKAELSGDLNEKVNKALMDMKSIGTAIESYVTDEYKSPEFNTIQELKGVLEPFHIRKLPTIDPWGNPYLYKHGTGDKKYEYFVGCGGSDGIFEGFEQTGTYTEFTGKDIIYGNGYVVYGPTR
jgi:hypothetical protein